MDDLRNQKGFYALKEEVFIVPVPYLQSLKQHPGPKTNLMLHLF